MDPMWQDINKLPNLISLARILMAPVLLVLAFNGQPAWFIGLYLFAEFTDALDGYLARKLDQMTPLGSHLDSWSDFIIYVTVAISAWLLWPDIMAREIVYFLVIVLCFILPAATGFIKFRKFTGYHTRSVKLAVLVTVLSFILLVTGVLDWPFRVATLFCVYAAVEEIAITLLIRREQVDVRSVWQALRLRRSKGGSKRSE